MAKRIEPQRDAPREKRKIKLTGRENYTLTEWQK
jgi:hypothetical protein